MSSFREHYIGKKVDPEYMLQHVDSWLEVEKGEHAVNIINTYVVTKEYFLIILERKL